jgi:hypothetical protein
MHDWQARSRGCGPHLQASAPERFGFVLGSSILDGMEGRGQRRARGPGAPPAAVAATAAGRPSVVGGGAGSWAGSGTTSVAGDGRPPALASIPADRRAACAQGAHVDTRAPGGWTEYIGCGEPITCWGCEYATACGVPSCGFVRPPTPKRPGLVAGRAVAECFSRVTIWGRRSWVAVNVHTRPQLWWTWMQMWISA